MPSARYARRCEPIRESDKAAVINDLRHRTVPECDDRRPTTHGFDHHQPEGFRPIDREEERARIREEILLFVLVDLADELDVRLGEQRNDHLVEIELIGGVDFGGGLDPAIRTPRQANGEIGPLLRRDAPKESEVPLRSGDGRHSQRRQTVMDRGHPVGESEGLALGNRDRDQRNLGKFFEKRHQLGQIEPTVQGRQKSGIDPPEQRKGHVVDVKMKNIKGIGGLRDALQHQMIGRQPVGDAAVETQSLPAHRLQVGIRDRVAAGKKRDVVAELDKLLGEI